MAKKVAVDCSRFHDKQNDIQTITDVNNALIAEKMNKHDNIEELDGNRFESFSKIPEDSRLPISMLTRENAPKPPTIEGGGDDEDGEDGAEAAGPATDIAKGVFSVKAFSGELGATGDKLSVNISMDAGEITIGETITEKFDNMVWPCKASVNLCKVSEFFETKGYDANFLAAKKKEFEDFKSAAHIEKDDNCVMMAFWQNRIIPVCLKDEKEVADLNAVAIKNYSKVMAYKKFFLMELNKKPSDVYEFPVKIFKEKTLTEESIKPLQQGIAKVDGTVLFE